MQTNLQKFSEKGLNLYIHMSSKYFDDNKLISYNQYNFLFLLLMDI